ncbi:serine hydrolase domain-containing protein [Pedobacter miscanthi]|nr:serine hydrolase domain-containing protein [Pedobacter miscanthi]
MKYIIMLLLATILCRAQGQQVNTAKLDSFFNILDSNHKAMGTFVIRKDGKQVYARSLGFRAVEKDTLLSDSLTRYRIGSITKVFTATMIFQLIEEGKLSLDTRLARFYPKMPGASEITIGQLLSHRSGLMDFVNDLTDKRWIAGKHSREQILDSIAKKAPHFAPGSKQLYCNSGYLILAGIIEKITGKSYPEALDSRIAKRVGLKHTLSGVPNNQGTLEASAYGRRDYWTQITDMYFPNVIGVGDVLSTPVDMLKFLSALSSGKLVSEKSFAQMCSFDREQLFGMGLMMVPFYSQSGFGHNGATFGSFSMLASFPKSGISLAMSINGQQYSLNEITIAMLSMANNMPFDLPSFREIKLSAELLKSYTGEYSSAGLPVKITISQSNGQLQAQATGQSGFPLQAVSDNTFRFDTAGIKIVFKPEGGQMLFSQGARSFVFSKVR